MFHLPGKVHILLDLCQSRICSFICTWRIVSFILVTHKCLFLSWIIWDISFPACLSISRTFHSENKCCWEQRVKWARWPLKKTCVLDVVLLSMPIFTNSHHTLSGKNEKCFLPITFPHTYHIVRISIWKRTHSLCSVSTTVRLYRQETTADHRGIHVYWAIILGGIVSCGRMFTMYVRLSIWGLFYFFLIQYSSLRLNTNKLTYPPNPPTKYTAYYIDWTTTSCRQTEQGSCISADGKLLFKRQNIPLVTLINYFNCSGSS